jgi:predicted O-methyltransferase YrrM
VKDLFYSLKSLVNYWLRKEGIYSIQSPNLFFIYSQLLAYKNFNAIHDADLEELRADFLKSEKLITIKEFGAGSKIFKSKVRSISKITRYSLTPQKYCLMYQYFCKLTPNKVVVELGANLGITTRYLSRATKGTVYTFEGERQFVEIFQQHLKEKNVEMIEGDIEITLCSKLKEIQQVDFALIDANHQENATINYFEHLLEKIHPESIFIIADIYWSEGMRNAWEFIIKHPKVNTTLDFHDCGVVFFNSAWQKSHRILEY